MEVTFEKDGKRKTLAGNHEVGVCKMISGKKLQRMFKNKFTKVAQLFSIQALEPTKDNTKQEGEIAITVSNNSHAQRKGQEI